MGEPIKPGATPSLPGAMSTRTDGGPASKQAIRYAAGEKGAEDFVNLQRQAPLAKAQTAKPMAPSEISAAAQSAGQQNQMMPQQGGPSAIPLGAPTQFPNEPVTNGAAAGPGAGPEALVLPSMSPTAQPQDMEKVRQYLPVLEFLATLPNASPTTINYVRYLRSL
jgi:hypothetical protein